MKKAVSLILFAVLLFVGCQDDNSILGPSDQLYVESHSPKGRIITPSYISMPDDGLAKLTEDEAYWYYTHYINDDNAFNLVIEDKYEAGIHGVVKVYVKLSVREGSTEDGKYVTLDVDKQNGIISFGPSAVFEGYSKLDVYFSGIDLTDVAEESLNFALVNEDGTTQEVNYNSIQVDQSTGTLQVSGAVVYSSAQYAWVIK